MRCFGLFWRTEPPKNVLCFVLINIIHSTDPNFKPNPEPNLKSNPDPNLKPNTDLNPQFDTATKNRQKTINYLGFYSPCQPLSLLRKLRDLKHFAHDSTCI